MFFDGSQWRSRRTVPKHSETKHLALLGIPDVLRCARRQETPILFEAFLRPEALLAHSEALLAHPASLLALLRMC